MPNPQAGTFAALGADDDVRVQQGRAGLHTMTREMPNMLRVGFVPLTDCAPLVMAQELRLFEKHGIAVRLSREIGWATIRDKIIFGELDAAHALASMPFAATLGFGCAGCHCVTGLVLSLNGNGITLSQELWQRGVRDSKSLREEIDASRGTKTYAFGVVFPHSSHNFLLRQWLESGGIDPDHDVRIVVVPAPSMFENLRRGNLDGYCVGEPWNSAAVDAGIGWCAATSLDLAPFHPEKVLMVQRRFAREREQEHLALIAALWEACAFCDRPENRALIAETLSRPQYLNLPSKILEAGLVERFHFGNGRSEVLPDLHLFSRRDANEPSTDKAAWVLRHLMRGAADKERSAFRTAVSSNVFDSIFSSKQSRLDRVFLAACLPGRCADRLAFRKRPAKPQLPINKRSQIAT